LEDELDTRQDKVNAKLDKKLEIIDYTLEVNIELNDREIKWLER
jgi:hypothetical protein